MADFEQKLTALELVVEKLERGDMSLEESVRLFEEGITLSNACKRDLAAAEGKIQVLAEQGSELVITDLTVETDIGEEEEDEE
jgi:exodeoxyribonuclease VII small subunit